jgi:cytochrome c2
LSSAQSQQFWPAAPALLAFLLAILLLGRIFVYAEADIHSTADRRDRAIAATGGNPERGRDLINTFGCSGCHLIPNIPGPAGMGGPPLDDMTDRAFIAGVVPNTADALIDWIVDPQRFDRDTAMPRTGISERQARDVAAYLLSLPEEGSRILWP